MTTQPKARLAIISYRIVALSAAHQNYALSNTPLAIERCEAIAIEIAELEQERADLKAAAEQRQRLALDQVQEMARGPKGTKPLGVDR